MKLLIWGIGKDYHENIEPYSFLVDQNMVVGYLDNDKQWGEGKSYKSKKVIRPDALLEENLEWDFILITSRKYQTEMLEQADKIGIQQNRILFYRFLYPFITEDFNNFFKHQFETEKIKIIKNWYVKAFRKCLIFSIEDKMGETLRLRILPQGMLGVYRKLFHANVVNLQNDEMEFEGTVDIDREIEVQIKNSYSVFRLEVDGMSHNYVIAEMEKNTMGKELDRISNMTTRNYFKRDLSRIYDLMYHENDYAVLHEYSEFKDFSIVDVGANQGQSSLSFLKATDMDVYAFEPHLGFVDTLNYIKTGYEGRFQYFSCGVGKEKNMLEFYQPKFEIDYTQESSFNREKAISRVERVLGNGLKITENNFDEYIKTIEVPVVSLDSIFSKMRIKPILFIKIDAEAFEEEVICGMTEIMKQFSPLILLEYNNEDAVKKIINYVNQFVSYRIGYWDSNEFRFRKENVYSSINYFLIPQNNKFFRVDDQGKIVIAIRR